jgi:hypothetical protein
MNSLKKWLDTIKKINKSLYLLGLVFLMLAPSKFVQAEIDSVDCERPYTESLNKGPSLILESCPQLKKRFERLEKTRLGLGFASEYPGNTASLFGHAFLIFLDENLVLSRTVSFLAETKDEKNPFLYIWRGVSGGYPASYKWLPFYQLETAYNGLESRDLYLYRFKDNEYDLLNLLFYLSEEDSKRKYYFLNYNCISGLRELLSIAFPSAENGGNKFLIDYPIYLFKDYQSQLELHTIIRSSEAAISDLRSSFSDERIKEIRSTLEGVNSEKIKAKKSSELPYLNALTSYYAFKAENVKTHNELLNRFELEENVIPRINVGEMNLNPTRLALTVGLNESKLFTRLIFSPSYKDILNSPLGSYSNNKLELLRTEFTVDKKSWSLSKLTLVELETNANFIWPVYKKSWKFLLEYDGAYNFNQSLQNLSSLTLVGMTKNFQNGFVNVLLGPRVTYFTKENDAYLLGHLSGRLVKEISKLRYTLELNISYHPFISVWSDEVYRATLSYLFNHQGLHLQGAYRSMFGEENREILLNYTVNF